MHIVGSSLESQRLSLNSKLFLFSQNKLPPIPGFQLRSPNPEADVKDFSGVFNLLGKF